MRLRKTLSTHRGFTIIELLIVIVVIGILASVTIVSYNGAQYRAQLAAAKASLSQLSDAIEIAQDRQHKPLIEIVDQPYTASACVKKPAGTDFADLPRTDPCWTDYEAALDAITTASGVDVRNFVDPWGRPFYIDANEWEYVKSDGTYRCNQDYITTFSRPYGGVDDRVLHDTDVLIPLSSTTSCS